MAENRLNDPEGLLGRVRRLEDALATERANRQKYELQASELADQVKELQRSVASLELENERLASGKFSAEELVKFRPLFTQEID